MRTFFVLTAVIVLAPFATAKVWTRVYRCDEKTLLAPVDAEYPTVFRDIMVGTHLVIVISSDANGFWSGMLRVSWDDANDVTLNGRGWDPESLHYAGSCLEAAGKDATVTDAVDMVAFGYSYSSDGLTAVPGDWFAFDYQAAQVGSVAVEMYDVASDYNVPVEVLSFTHVPSRDFDGDHIVNFKDLALLARTWRLPRAADANSPETRSDLDADRRVGMSDLALLAGYWLERTSRSEPAGTPTNSPPAP